MGDKLNENSNGEHFNTLDTSGKAQAFIRETFQNSIDGAISDDSKVKIRIYLSGENGANDKSVWSKYFVGFEEHLEACQEEIPYDPSLFEDGKCRFVVIEDFGTSGLTGDYAATEILDSNVVNHFYHFFRAVGRTGKGSKALGSWGIGKIVFQMASEARALFGLTVRNEESSEARRVLIGQTTLRHHRINNVSYVNDGWFATNEKNEFALPILDGKLLDQFSQEWKLSRTNEPGLSIVVPFCNSLTRKELIRSIAEEYCGKLLEGLLEVEIEDEDSKGKTIMNKETIIPLAQSNRGDKTWDEVTRMATVLNWYLNSGKLKPTCLLSTGEIHSPDWSKVALSDSEKEMLFEELQSQESICIRIPVGIKRKAGLRESSFFDIVISTSGDHNNRSYYTEFFRKWLRISGRRMGSSLSGIQTFVFADDGILNELLRSSEGPAHTEWSPSRDSFAGKFELGPNWLTFVKQAPKNLVADLFGGGSQRDHTAFGELFPKSGNSRPKPNAGARPKPGGGHTGVGDPPPPPPQDIRLGQIEDGFSLTVQSQQIEVFVEVEMAFDTTRGDPFRKWRIFDFLAQDLMIQVVEGSAEVQKVIDNKISILVSGGQTSKIYVTGFNDHRDLKVRAEIQTEANS